MRSRVSWGLCLAVAFSGCRTGAPDPCLTDPDSCNPEQDPCASTGGVCLGALRINEVMSNNEGAWIDGALEADDWIELVNTGSEPVRLLGYTISDSLDAIHLLPGATLAAGEALLLWADGTPTQGVTHLPFKLSSEGETLFVWSPEGRLVERVNVPPLVENESFTRLPNGTGEFARCGFATAGRANGDFCGPPPPPDLPIDVVFSSFDWPQPWPAIPSPLVLSELALRPASFVEVANSSDSTVDLTQYAVTVSSTAPGLAWPDESMGVLLSWPALVLAPGERLSVTVDESAAAVLAASPEYEGVVTLWRAGEAIPVDRVDFMSWPEGAALARFPESAGTLRFCAALTEGTFNHNCEPLASRPVGERLRHLYTPGDLAALAAGGTALGVEGVEFVVDMEAGDVVHLLSSAAWDLHYTFIRERIDGEPHLDRCDPEQNQLFYQGWVRFSQEQYAQVEGRRYLLGTLEHYSGTSLSTVEFTTGDRITAPLMLRAFFAAMSHVDEPTRWSLRPQGPQQTATMLLIDGQAPIVDENAPFRGVELQPLNKGIAYGVLKFVPAEDLDEAALGPQVVVVTDQVPNDIPLVGGLITEAFQTPLAHVNVLSSNRGTPNMALTHAREDERVAPFFDTLVRFEVTAAAFEIRQASAEEAEAYWESLQNQGPPLEPRLDLSVRGVQPLAGLGLDALPAIGAKAAQLAELANVVSACPGPIDIPSDAFAVPLVHSLEHYAASGAAERLAMWEADPTFRTDPRVRAAGLAEVREMIMDFPVDAELLAAVEERASTLFGSDRLKLRSSSNNEDLAGFNGAGLYTSASAGFGDAEHTVKDAMRLVWASLYNMRAYDERSYYNVDASKVAMGILVHRATLSERANGVAISRDLLNPIRADTYYINAQVGEATVTNPAPGVGTEQLLYRWGRTPRVVVQAESSLPYGVPVLAEAEADRIACALRAIHNHFRPLLDPEQENRWFAMDIEFKLIGLERQLFVKQARPYTFGKAHIPEDCREI